MNNTIKRRLLRWTTFLLLMMAVFVHISSGNWSAAWWAFLNVLLLQWVIYLTDRSRAKNTAKNN